ncbi:membrane protein YcjF [Vibrio variabilis]|uniref:Membrane protein YcjF n=1 Tax=Vibrio variabilis TaxID=990271 RepID=A0ABQ0JLX4_9VIBR|nr:membrane protein YcjF [Vibrio variabilis]
MSDVKNRKVFNEDLSNVEQTLDMNSQKLFEPEQTFVPVEPSSVEQEDEKQLEKTIRGSSKKGWIATTFLTAFAGLVGWQAIDNVITAATTGDYLSLGWSALVTGVAVMGIGAFGKELFKLRKLKNHFSVQEEAQALLDNDAVGKGEKFCQKLAQEAQIPAENPAFDRWQTACIAPIAMLKCWICISLWCLPSKTRKRWHRYLCSPERQPYLSLSARWRLQICCLSRGETFA